MNKILAASAIEAALNKPQETLHRIFTGEYGITVAKTMGLFGADTAQDGESPAGFYSRVDAIDTIPGTGLTRDGQAVNEIWNEMQAMLSAFNASNDAIVALFSFPTITENEKVGVPVSPGFQVATEFGRPRKVRVREVTRGFPLLHYDIADGFTQEYIDDAPSQALMAVQATVLESWSRLQRELTLNAILQDANVTDQDGILVKRLYNGDGEVPPEIKRWTHAGTHTHYLFGGGGGFVEGDLDAMGDHLIHHGFREYGDSTFILHAHRTDLAAIRAFTNFIPSSEAEFPRILVESGVVTGDVRTQGAAGLRVEGFVNDWTVVQNNDMVEGYLIGQVSGGPMDLRNPVGFRQHKNPSARGLRLIEGARQNYPLYDSVYDGYAGAGIGQRGAAVVMQDAASYTAPTTLGLGE